MFKMMKKEHVLRYVFLQLKKIINFSNISQLLHFSSVQCSQRDTSYWNHALYTWESIPPGFPKIKKKNEKKDRTGQGTP